MYVIGSYDTQGNLRPALMDKIRLDSARTSLSAVGWGLLYPDLIRVVPVLGSLANYILFGQHVDRGLALEQEWVSHWDGHLWEKPPTIGQWSEDVANGTRPAAIFNATAAESGQRFLIASTLIKPSERSTIQFANVFASYDIPVSTAARVSATFPWVSPMAQASDGDDKFRVHLADGGYYDNSGVLSATQWLREAADKIGEHPVLFIVIDSTPRSPAQGKSWSWQRQAVGPIETLLSVRDSSQQSRTDYELDLVLKYLRDRKMNIERYDLFYPADELTPLSWHLTPEQQRRIGEAWSNPIEPLKSAIQNVEAQLSCLP